MPVEIRSARNDGARLQLSPSMRFRRASECSCCAKLPQVMARSRQPGRGSARSFENGTTPARWLVDHQPLDVADLVAGRVGATHVLDAIARDQLVGLIGRVLHHPPDGQPEQNKRDAQRSSSGASCSVSRGFAKKLPPSKPVLRRREVQYRDAADPSIPVGDTIVPAWAQGLSAGNRPG